MNAANQNGTTKSPGAWEALTTKSGEMKAVVIAPEDQSGYGYFPPVLFWKVRQGLWKRGEITMEVCFEANNDETVTKDSFVLPAPEGSVIMERNILSCRIRYSKGTNNT